MVDEGKSCSIFLIKNLIPKSRYFIILKTKHPSFLRRLRNIDLLANSDANLRPYKKNEIYNKNVKNL